MAERVQETKKKLKETAEEIVYLEKEIKELYKSLREEERVLSKSKYTSTSQKHQDIEIDISYCESKLEYKKKEEAKLVIALSGGSGEEASE